MAKIHDLFIVELAEVIKGYGNEPDDKDPFRLSEFYRFYELPNIAISRENFEKMRPIEPERKTGKWILTEPDAPCFYRCDHCGRLLDFPECFCPTCGTDMRGEQDG